MQRSIKTTVFERPVIVAAATDTSIANDRPRLKQPSTFAPMRCIADLPLSFEQIAIANCQRQLRTLTPLQELDLSTSRHSLLCNQLRPECGRPARRRFGAGWRGANNRPRDKVLPRPVRASMGLARH